jgi:hypothetical protein
MAEPWIKLRTTLVRSPKIRALAREMKCHKYAALGVAVAWLALIDEQTVDGKINLSPAELDDELGFKGCSKALCSVGWAALGEDGLVEAVEFGKHCGTSAKERALNTKRTEKGRAKRAENVTEETEHLSRCERDICHGESVTFVTENVTVKTGQKRDQNKKENILIKDVSYVPNNNTVVTSGDQQPKARSGRPLPESAEEVRNFMAAQPICGLKGDELAACASGFFDDMEAQGWTARNGAPLFDWHAAARRYLNTWQRRNLQPLGTRSKAATPVVYRSETKPDYSL